MIGVLCLIRPHPAPRHCHRVCAYSLPSTLTVAPLGGRITLSTSASLTAVYVVSFSNTLPCDAHRIYIPSETRNFMNLILPKGFVKMSEVLSCVEIDRTSTSPD